MVGKVWQQGHAAPERTAFAVREVNAGAQLSLSLFSPGPQPGTRAAAHI